MSKPTVSGRTRSRVSAGTVLKLAVFALAVLFIGYLLGGLFPGLMHLPTAPAPTPQIVTVVNTETIEVEKEAEKYTLTVGEVKRATEKAADLITTKYTYQDADTAEDFKQIKGVKLPLTTSSVVFTYSGTVSLGVPLSEVRYAVDNDAVEITVTLPEVRILAHEIDLGSFEYISVSSSVFNPADMERTTEQLEALKQKTERDVLENKELMDQVLRNTRAVFIDLLAANDATGDFRVVFS